MHKFLTPKNLYNPRNQLDLKQWFFKIKKKDPKLKSKNERERLQQQTTQQKQYQGDGFSTLACMFTPVW
jgi:hypothetical protein